MLALMYNWIYGRWENAGSHLQKSNKLTKTNKDTKLKYDNNRKTNLKN